MNACIAVSGFMSPDGPMYQYMDMKCKIPEYFDGSLRRVNVPCHNSIVKGSAL